MFQDCGRNLYVRVQYTCGAVPLAVPLVDVFEGGSRGDATSSAMCSVRIQTAVADTVSNNKKCSSCQKS